MSKSNFPSQIKVASGLLNIQVTEEDGGPLSARAESSLSASDLWSGSTRKAKQAARGDSQAEERVAFIAKGFRHAELTLAVQVAFEGYRRSGDLRTYRAAMEALDSFRAEVERDNIANMAYLAWAESMTWDRTLLSLMKEPGDPLP